MKEIYILFEHRPQESRITAVGGNLEKIFDTLIERSKQYPQTLVKLLFNYSTGKAEVILMAEAGDINQWLELDNNWKIKTHDTKEK